MRKLTIITENSEDHIWCDEASYFCAAPYNKTETCLCVRDNGGSAINSDRKLIGIITSVIKNHQIDWGAECSKIKFVRCKGIYKLYDKLKDIIKTHE